MVLCYSVFVIELCGVVVLYWFCYSVVWYCCYSVFVIVLCGDVDIVFLL